MMGSSLALLNNIMGVFSRRDAGLNMFLPTCGTSMKPDGRTKLILVDHVLKSKVTLCAVLFFLQCRGSRRLKFKNLILKRLIGQIKP